MKLVRLCLAVLSVTISTGCAASPTATSPAADPSAFPTFDGGGYMGNGGRVDTAPDSSAVGDGGGYMGNGG